jgi:hypothetical protein
MSEIQTAITDSEAVMDLAELIAALGYDSLRDVLVIAAGNALAAAFPGRPEPLQHLAVLRSQCEGLIAELQAGRS